MNRQQRREQARALRAQPVYTPTTEAARQQGYADGWKAACDFAMKTCYAASVMALHDLEGYGKTRSKRFLRAMDAYVVNTLTSEDAINAALDKVGVKIMFREVFPQDRIAD